MRKIPTRQAIKRYLSVHAESFVRNLPLPALEASQNLIVVPVYDEAPQALIRALQHPFTSSTCLIWVFNCPENAPLEAAERTRNCLAQMIEAFSFQSFSPEGYLAQTGENLKVILLDFAHSERCLPQQEGVGLARKLGMDLALKICLRQLESGQALPDWIHSSDADVCWPERYTRIPPPDETQVVSLYPIRHQAEAGWEQAMTLYDFRLDYYVEQLHEAGSPYAFQTVGSAIAVTPEAYAQVHGMPKRSGGEDFYFLNKLAKIGQVCTLDGPFLEVAGRPSTRVPFGTGPALVEIASLASPVQDYCFYHPMAFTHLDTLLTAAGTYEHHAENPGHLFALLPEEHRAIIEGVLVSLGFERFWRHQVQQGRSQSFARLFHTWFDGFRTLKFIHGMRDQGYPDLTLSQLRDYQGLLSPDLVARIEALLHD